MLELQVYATVPGSNVVYKNNSGRIQAMPFLTEVLHAACLGCMLFSVFFVIVVVVVGCFFQLDTSYSHLGRRKNN